MKRAVKYTIYRFAVWLIRHTLADGYFTFTHAEMDAHDEVLKREWLEKGYVRGQSAKRTPSPFCLYLVGAAEVPAEGDKARTQNIVRELQADWLWWAVVNPQTGGEVCIGQLQRFPVLKAVDVYLDLLTQSHLDLLGAPYRTPPMQVSDTGGLVPPSAKSEQPGKPKATCVFIPTIEMYKVEETEETKEQREQERPKP